VVAADGGDGLEISPIIGRRLDSDAPLVPDPHIPRAPSRHPKFIQFRAANAVAVAKLGDRVDGAFRLWAAARLSSRRMFEAHLFGSVREHTEALHRVRTRTDATTLNAHALTGRARFFQPLGDRRRLFSKVELFLVLLQTLLLADFPYD